MPNTPEPNRQYTPKTDAELEALAEITPSDIEDAKAAWEEDAPAPFKKLLDAQPDEAPPAE